MGTPAERSAFPWAGFCVGYLLGYFVSTAVPTPLLWYHPLARRFSLEVHPAALAADYYGRVLLSLAFGGVGFLVARGFARGSLPARLRALSFWVGLLVVFTAGLYVFLLATRQPIPAPLPVGYVPR